MHLNELRPRRRVFSIVLLAAGLFLTGCGGGDGCCCDGPRRAHDWLISLTVGQVPSHVAEYPVFVNVAATIVHTETGQSLPSAIMVTLSVSPGSFDGAGPEIQGYATNGRIEATVQVDEPGTYKVTVAVDGESITASAYFSIDP